MKVVKNTFGKITWFTSKETGMPCADWRAEFIELQRADPGIFREVQYYLLLTLYHKYNDTFRKRCYDSI